MVHAATLDMRARMQRVCCPAIWLVVAACGNAELKRGPEADAAPPAVDAPPADAAIDGPPQFSSCAGLPATCGAAANGSCCQAAMVPGGTFFRGYDGGSIYRNMDAPATVSPFVLDTFEVTVGRFRGFVNAGLGTRASAPAAGSGAHPHLAGSGWDPGWNVRLPASSTAFTTALKCDAAQTWTDAVGTNENKPIMCVSWFEAMAFCIWDGGYLPTDAEWNFAAAGGSEQRVYPWSNPPSSTTIDCSYANYNIDMPAGTSCVGTPNRVGSESPKGDGRWGHADLGGNVGEWMLDWYDDYPVPCNDCALLTPTTSHSTRGGGYSGTLPFLPVAGRATTTLEREQIGFRCARPL